MIMINILLLKNLISLHEKILLQLANLANKSDITNFVKKTDFDDKTCTYWKWIKRIIRKSYS